MKNNLSSSASVQIKYMDHIYGLICILCYSVAVTSNVAVVTSPRQLAFSTSRIARHCLVVGRRGAGLKYRQGSPVVLRDLSQSVSGVSVYCSWKEVESLP